MPLAGYCAECGGNVWLDSSGGCSSGHPASSMSGVYETQPVSGVQVSSAQAVSAQSAIALGQAYWRELNECERNVKSVTKSWDKAIRDAEKQLDEARRFGTKKLDSYGAVVLHENAVKTSQGTINLEIELVTATVDTAGALMETRRSTLTRMAAGGLLLGPLGFLAGGMLQKKSKDDTRELYLIIESQSIASIVQCRPDHGSRVRKLAAAINVASRGAPARAVQRAQVIPEWERRIAQLRQQRDTAIGAATMQLEAKRSEGVQLQLASGQTPEASAGGEPR